GRDDGGGGHPHWWLGAQQLTGYALFNLRDTSGAGDFLIDSKPINNNQWHQLVAVRDENVNMNRLYVDGVKVDSVFFDYTAGFEAATTLGIGYMAYNATPSYFYDGLLDDVALYDRALSDGEIQAHYAAGQAGHGYCDQFILTQITVGNGNVVKSLDKPSYFYSDSVIVTAMPDQGWLFDGWSGGLTGSQNPDTIVMVSDTTVTCTFSEDPTGVGDTPSVKVLTLLQNTPNPFNQGTFFSYGLPQGTDVTFGVYDIAGRRVFEKRLSNVPAGWHRFYFDGKDLNGRSLATGVYFYRLKTPREMRAGKMVVIK
ncbi:MAG: T9SS type A sorting domain-containing protein, partial [Candidatus Latescibacterota bacterium]